MGDNRFVTLMSSRSPPLTTSGYQYLILAPPGEPGTHNWYLFTCTFKGFRIAFSDANDWNSQGPVIATLDENGEPRLTMFVLRNDLSVKGFTQHLGLWLQMLEKFGGALAPAGLWTETELDAQKARSNRAGTAAVPPEILSSIRSKAGAEWPTDYLMQAHVIEQQSIAYCEVLALPPADLPQSVRRTIKSKAIEEWPNDFVMQKHIIDQQVEAYRLLHG
jgi:hypothetical protein